MKMARSSGETPFSTERDFRFRLNLEDTIAAKQGESIASHPGDKIVGERRNAGAN
jgi:hypothetical protein